MIQPSCGALTTVQERFRLAWSRLRLRLFDLAVQLADEFVGLPDPLRHRRRREDLRLGQLHLRLRLCEGRGRLVDILVWSVASFGRLFCRL